MLPATRSCATAGPYQQSALDPHSRPQQPTLGLNNGSQARQPGNHPSSPAMLLHAVVHASLSRQGLNPAEARAAHAGGPVWHKRKQQGASQHAGAPE